MFLNSCAAVLLGGGGFCARAAKRAAKTATKARRIDVQTRMFLRITHPKLSEESLAKRREKRGTRFAERRSGIDFAALGQIGDAVGCAECERFDGFGWLTTTGSHEAAAVTDEKILDVVGAMIRIDDGRLRI